MSSARRLPVLCALLVLCVLSYALCTTATTEADSGNGGGSQSVQPVAITTVEQYLQTVNPRGTPVVLVIFDHQNADAVQRVWRPLVNQLASNLGALQIPVVYTTATSEIGQTILTQMLGDGASENALLFFNAILAPTGEEGGGYAKLPTAYQGKLSSEQILRWAVQSISAEAIEVIETDADLSRLLGMFPGFPELARVLYFTDADEVGPVYKVTSQQFIGDAVFGVVQHPFSTAEKAAIAKRYGVTSLPAILVLRADPEHDGADLVVPLPGVSKGFTAEQLITALVGELPQSSFRVAQEAQKTNDQSAFLHVHQRKMHVHDEISRRHAKVLDGLREAALETPVVPHTQQQWQDACVDLPPRHSCLIAVAADNDSVGQVTQTLHVAAQRLFKAFPDLSPAVVQRVVLNAATSPKLVDFFGAGKNGFPDLLLIEHRVGGQFAYHNFVGAFVPERIANFCATQLTAGSGGHSYKLHDVPPLLSGSAAADSGDADDGDL